MNYNYHDNSCHEYSRINQIKIAEGTTKNPLMIGGGLPSLSLQCNIFGEYILNRSHNFVVK